MQGKYLSEIVNMNDFEYGKINLIYAPCGSGKTTFAKTELLKYFLYGYDYEEYGSNVDKESDMYWYANIEDVATHHDEKILYLIDTAMGKEQLLHSKGAVQSVNQWTGDLQWILPGFHVMTYAGYGYLCEHYPEHNKWKTDSLIVCDEMHNAVKWSKYKKKKETDNADQEEINYHASALWNIMYSIYMECNMVIALSATPDILFKTYGNGVHKVKLLGEPRHFEERDYVEYNDLENLLRHIPSEKRGIIYVTHISEIIKYQQLLDERGITNVALWSINNKEKPLSQKQKDVRDYIIRNREMPPDVQVLFINKSCETSITIGDEERTKHPIDYMIIHSREEDTVIQARGRYRNDLDILYCREPDVYDTVEVPYRWIGRKLSKADKDALCEYLGLKDSANGRLLKWTTIKKVLAANGYTIFDIRESGERFSIIRSPEAA